MNAWVWPLALGALALVVVALAVLLVRAQSRLVRLERHLVAVEPTETVPSPTEAAITEEIDTPALLITHIDDPDPPLEPARIEGRLFVDLVARESVVMAGASWAGLRRALSAESRARIRFTMRQGARAARKRRKAQEREARRMVQRGEVA